MATNSSDMKSMTDRSMARRTRSGMLVGPGLLKNWRPRGLVFTLFWLQSAKGANIRPAPLGEASEACDALTLVRAHDCAKDRFRHYQLGHCRRLPRPHRRLGDAVRACPQGAAERHHP